MYKFKIDIQHFASKKGVGSSKNGRDSNSQRLGIKLFDGQLVKAGNIICRQRGTKFHPGLNVKRGSDDTLFATSPGYIKFHKTKKNTKINVVSVKQ